MAYDTEWIPVRLANGRWIEISAYSVGLNGIMVRARTARAEDGVNIIEEAVSVDWDTGKTI